MGIAETFLLNYARAYLDFNATTLTRFFHLPCVIVDQSGTHSLNDLDSVVEYETPFLRVLESAAVDDIKLQLLDIHSKSPNLTFVTANYKLATNGTTIADFDYHYLLMQPDSEIKIVLAHYGEVRLWNL